MSSKILELPTWLTVKLGTHKDVKSLQRALPTRRWGSSTGVDTENEAHDSAKDIMSKAEFTLASEEITVELVITAVAELGFSNNKHCYEYKSRYSYSEICTRIKALGYDLCPAEVGPQLRRQHKYQPKMLGRIKIAMEPIADSKGDLQIFAISYGEGSSVYHPYKRAISTRVCNSNDSYDSTFDTEEYLVFMRRK